MRLDNTRCTSGLVFLGSRSLDLPFLATRLDRVLSARGFEVGAAEVMSDEHLKMSLGGFDLHMTVLNGSVRHDQKDGMEVMDQAMGNAQQRQAVSELGVANATQTLTVTIVKLPSDLPSLREAERSTVTAHSALALATLELAQVLDPDFVQWLQPDMMLQTTSFLSVLEKVTPRRVSAADRANAAAAERRRRPSPVLPFSQTQANRVSRLFPDIDDTCDRLESRTRDEAITAQPVPAQADAANVPRLRAAFLSQPDTATGDDVALAGHVEPGIPARLATWAVSLAVSILSLPVGLALMIYNLIRGEDLRLALTALALTGLFTGLVNLGLAEKAMTTLMALPHVGELLSRLPF